MSCLHLWRASRPDSDGLASRWLFCVVVGFAINNWTRPVVGLLLAPSVGAGRDTRGLDPKHAPSKGACALAQPGLDAWVPR